jgi:hypothetical protein
MIALLHDQAHELVHVTTSICWHYFVGTATQSLALYTLGTLQVAVLVE